MKVVSQCVVLTFLLGFHVHLTIEPLAAQERQNQVRPPQRAVVENPPQRAVVENQIRPMPLPDSFWPLLDKIVPTTPVPEEEEFVELLSDRIKHTTAVVISDPTRTFPRSSLAARLSESYLRVGADKRVAMTQRAQGLLTDSETERMRYFGTLANESQNAAHLNAATIMDRAMHAKLRQAIRARLDAVRPELIETLTLVEKEFAKLPRTWLEAGIFTGEIQDATGKKKIGFSQPQAFDFRWNTVQKAAERGYWQLIQPSQPLQPLKILASGDAGVSGSVFSIDFSKYLPPEPPGIQGIRIYHVRVVPQRQRSFVSVQGITPSAGDLELWLNVGAWSEPVIVTYAVDTTPPVPIDLPELYRKASFNLDEIDMVEDQTGAGDEEFFVMGFVQETWLETVEQKGQLKLVMMTGKRVKFGPYETVLCAYPEDPCSSHKYNKEIVEFHLNNPNQPEWPRTFIYVISVMEADGGAELAEWQSDVWSISNEIVEGEIADIVEEYIDELIVDEAIHITAEAIQTIISTISSATLGAIGTAVAAAAISIFAIVSEMEDDFYGADSAVIALSNNLTGTIHLFNGKATGGEYRLGSRWPFYGMPLKGVAGGWDGKVNIYFHWQFSKKEYYQ